MSRLNKFILLLGLSLFFLSSVSALLPFVWLTLRGEMLSLMVRARKSFLLDFSHFCVGNRNRRFGIPLTCQTLLSRLLDTKEPYDGCEKREIMEYPN